MVSKTGGIHAVAAILSQRDINIEKILFNRERKDRRLQSLVDKAQQLNVSIEFVDKKELDEKSGSARHQGVLVFFHARKAMNENDLKPFIEALDEDPFLLVLDGVTDPHNLGACLRTADAAGVHAVITAKDNSASLTDVVRKVASGAAESVPLVQVNNLARALDDLKSMGVWLTGTSDQAEQSLYTSELTGPLALVLGAEGKGMRRLTSEKCDFLISIPMAGRVSSLNVSVASGVCLFEARRQRLL